jgi:type I restriction enzyme S subunit
MKKSKRKYNNQAPNSKSGEEQNPWIDQNIKCTELRFLTLPTKKTNLPDGWQEVELGNTGYFEILSSGIAQFEGERDYLSTESIQGTDIKKIECKITYENRPSRANMQPVINSVWFAKMKSTLKVYCFEENNKNEAKKYILSTGFCGIKVNEKLVCPQYLRFFLISKEFNEEKDKLSTGSTQMGINNEFIAKVRLLIPPLATQKRIVQILEKAEQAKRKRKEADKLTNDYLKSVFYEMFLKDKGKFEKVKLGEVARLTMGGTPLTSIREYWENGTINWMKSGDIKGDFIYSVPNKITKLGSDNSNTESYPVDTVVIALNGQGKTRGTTAILKLNTTSNQSVAGILLKKDKALPEYIHYNLKLRYQELRNITGDSERSGLNLTILRNLSMIIPSLSLQQNFAKIVERVEKLKEKQRKSKEKINDMFNVLMQKAFKGELVR